MKRNNLNIKLTKAVQKGLNEALSNYDLTVLDDEDSVLVKNDAYKHSSIYDDLIDKNISEFLDDDEMFKNIVEKMILVGRQYTVKNKGELKSLIDRSIEEFGNECNLNWIDTSQITNMQGLFEDINNFNGHIEKWDVSNVTNMSYMFNNAFSFNQPLNNWDVSKVKDMHCMFYRAKLFNQPISNWDVSNCNNMGNMFTYAYSFNQNINNWNVSNVEDMSGMFSYAKSFNQPLGNWDVSNVINMFCMFYYAESFNQPISNWDVNNVKYNLNIFSICPIKKEYEPKFRKW